MSASSNDGAPLVRYAADDGAGGSGPGRGRTDPPRIRLLPEGPLLVEGPAEIVMPDGTVIRCERPVMALCTCRRSLRAPFCDTSHRSHARRSATRPPRKAESS
ncbi:CDGSH iron-sulfur domain-containing protein [Streptomyces sp. E-08]|uniref:CDGSH iron-sulfur domain-containing protein n=1 Tax=Streptomyces sp. E-08 TaxID=3404047 RepID=UPI003CF35858